MVSPGCGAHRRCRLDHDLALAVELTGRRVEDDLLPPRPERLETANGDAGVRRSRPPPMVESTWTPGRVVITR